MNTRARPWMKFYGADWRSDIGLRSCSSAARGFWIDLLTLMHETTPYGHLLIGGQSPTPRQIVAVLGGSEAETRRLLAELEQFGVFSRTDEGVLYSRRMVRDQVKAERDQANGRGGGNPLVKAAYSAGGLTPGLRVGVNPGVKGGVKAQKPEARSQKEKLAARPKQADMPLPVAAPKPRMPTFNDPPEAWLHLGDGQEVKAGSTHATLGGVVLDEVARMCCDAARLNGHSTRQNWAPLIGWLRDGLDFHNHVLPTLRQIGSRPSYQPPRAGLAYFDGAVRDRRAA